MNAYRLLFLSLLLTALMFKCSTTHAERDEVEITALIKDVAEAGDRNNAEKLKLRLHKDFRIIMNKLFTPDSILFMSKPVFTSMIADKAMGGDTRTVEIMDMQVMGENAFVRARFNGHTMDYESFILLVKDQGKWLWISELPHMLEVKK